MAQTLKKRYENLYAYEKTPGLSFDQKNPRAISRTKQSFAKEADINHIVSKYIKTGVMDNLRANPPLWGDFSQDVDFQTIQNKIIAANQAFLSLPAETRAMFNNDIPTLLAYINNPNNKQKCIELGLLPQEPAIVQDAKDAKAAKEAAAAAAEPLPAESTNLGKASKATTPK